MEFVKLLKRTITVTFGLFLYAVGIYVTVHANIGLAPWDALSQGLSNVTGIAFGTLHSLVGGVILLFTLFMKEKIGIATILNTVLIGVFVNMLNALKILPLNNSFPLGIAMLLAGQVILCFGSYFYIKAGLGCGPRDTLMVAMGKKLKKAPIGLVRGLLEGSALLTGFLLGAKVGLGTVIAVFGIGVLLQYTFKLLRFDVKAVAHDSIFDTYKQLKKELNNNEKTEPTEDGKIAEEIND